MPRYENRIGRNRSQLQIRGTPVVTVMLGSMTASLIPMIAQAPLIPPFGLMLLIAWRLLRPEIWPLWIGLPLGLFDDLMSGQPIGSAVLLWTIILLALDFESQRHFWRDYWHGWFTAALAIAFALAGGWIIVRFAGYGGSVIQIVPQIAYSVGFFPLVVRICAVLDRWRLP
jgi:rod shape-determining protein MreD